MVRQAIFDAYKEDTYTRGFRVYTTLSKKHQDAAYVALRQGMLEYDERQGYRGAEGYYGVPDDVTDEQLEDALQDEAESDGILPAIVLEATSESLTAYGKGGEKVTIVGEALEFAELMIGKTAPPKTRVKRGALIRVQNDRKTGWKIVQIPKIEGAFVSLDADKWLTSTTSPATGVYNSATALTDSMVPISSSAAKTCPTSGTSTKTTSPSSSWA